MLFLDSRIYLLILRRIFMDNMSKNGEIGLAGEERDHRIVFLTAKCQEIRTEMWNLLKPLQAELDTLVDAKHKEELEKKPDYCMARDFYQAGWRINGWDTALTDTNQSIDLSRVVDGKEEVIETWADGQNRNTDTAFDTINEAMGTELPINDNVMRYLANEF
jgi:hypothetical protein